MVGELWLAMYAPRGTAEGAIATMREAISKTLVAPEMVEFSAGEIALSLRSLRSQDAFPLPNPFLLDSNLYSGPNASMAKRFVQLFLLSPGSDKRMCFITILGGTGCCPFEGADSHFVLVFINDFGVKLPDRFTDIRQFRIFFDDPVRPSYFIRSRRQA